uniref:Uncharacterized protein n=1 Tax=Panagrolaimus davidi TaxID=227884 RepID=A0A914PF38_9BILA
MKLLCLIFLLSFFYCCKGQGFLDGLGRQIGLDLPNPQQAGGGWGGRGGGGWGPGGGGPGQGDLGSHPEWVMNGRGNLPRLPIVGGGGIEIIEEIFPNLNFQLPPIPKLNLPDVLQNVPSVLRNFIPAPLLGQITEFARNAIRVCA